MVSPDLEFSYAPQMEVEVVTSMLVEDSTHMKGGNLCIADDSVAVRDNRHEHDGPSLFRHFRFACVLCRQHRNQCKILCCGS